MEDLKRFDIAAFGEALMVVVESDLLPPEPAIVVIPLLADYPAITLLNPVVRHQVQDLVLATRLIASVRRSQLRRVGSAHAQADDITRAMDVLFSGI